MALVSRFVVYLVLFGCIFYDTCCMFFGWPTVSATVREIDYQSGGLIRWGWLALWLHWFMPMWAGGTRG